MNLFTFHRYPSNPSLLSSQSPTLFCSFNPISSQSPTLLCSFNPISSTRRNFSISAKIPARKIPARDRIIDFGKHKGKMLGTLPSKYLKWVSKNLRGRDFLEWALLADEVLEDPIYKDRAEWELAENLMTGDNEVAARRNEGNVWSGLLEISERFGWDFDDEIGWSRIKFALLGTSKGGRIPRKRSSFRGSDQIEEMGSSTDEDSWVGREGKSRVLNKGAPGQLKKMGISSDKDSRVNRRVSQMGKTGYSMNEELRVPRGKKLGSLSTGPSRVSIEAEDVLEEDDKGVRMSREERRERQRLKRALQMNEMKLKIALNKKKENRDDDHHPDQNQDKDVRVNKISSPFPGRETLLKKVMNKGKSL